MACPADGRRTVPPWRLQCGTLDAGEFSNVLSGFSMALTEAGGGALAVELDKLIGWVQAPYARAELVSMHFSLVSLRRFLVDAWIEDQHQVVRPGVRTWPTTADLRQVPSGQRHVVFPDGLGLAG